MATLQQLETAMENARAAGDMQAARGLRAVLERERQRIAETPAIEGINAIPGMDPAQVPETRQQPEQPGLMDYVQGAGEAALTTATAATGGVVGGVGGFLKGVAEEMVAGEFGTNAAADRIEQDTMAGMQALTYAPRSEVGQDIVQGLGEVGQQLAPIAPLAAETAAIGTAVRAAAPVASQAARTAGQRVATTADRLKAELPPAPGAPGFKGGNKSVGSAQLDDIARRRAMADELPVPVKLTEGEAARSYTLMGEEERLAKMGDIGDPLRQHRMDNNLRIQQNMDAFIDGTGAELADIRDVGEFVVSALEARKTRDKTKIRTLYKEAEKAGETSDPIDVTVVVDFLNESSSAESLAPVLAGAKKEMQRLGFATVDETGQLVPSVRPANINDMEVLRKFVNKTTGAEPTNIKYASDLKRVIDGTTENAGGEKYKAARAARAEFAADYENIGLISDLLGTKRGTSDRAVALENVVNQAVFRPATSVDSMKQLKRLLDSEGETGQQAWRELQGATLRNIRDAAYKSVATNERGERMISPAALDRLVNKLDETGKLDVILDTPQAEKLRLLNDVVKDIMTSPPGVVNHSNTASALVGIVDLVMAAGSGIPAPVASSIKIFTDRLRDKKLKARVRRALGEADTNEN